MKRYPAFDPPEYLHFKPDPGIVAEFGQLLARDPERLAIVQALPVATLLKLYDDLLTFRLHDIMLKRWVRQGVLTKAWLGTGEEAVSVGTVRALAPGDAVGPMIRNAGVCHLKGMSVADMFRGYLGTADSPTGGRDLHIGDLAKGIITPISHVASLLPVCGGIALSFKLRRQALVALTYVGDGATRTAEFHEGMNFAAVQKLPLIAVIQDNQVALGTALSRHTLPGVLESLHEAYGAIGLEADGNNVLDVYAATHLLAARVRAGEGAGCLVAHTFRMGGHATHDEAEARHVLPPEMFERWGARDPIGVYEAWLISAGHADEQRLAAIEDEVIARIEAAALAALASRSRHPDPATVADGVWAKSPQA